MYITCYLLAVSEVMSLSEILGSRISVYEKTIVCL